MKLNKTILFGFLFIALGGFVFISDILNPIIRPITYTFLMGSSKGKDIMFFALMGILLILSQIIPRKIDVTKYLKISIVIGSVLLILGNLLEVVFRLQMGIKLNTVFCSMTNTMSSTSILHTHLLKSILGEVITKIMGPFVQSNINTGVGLYSYVPTVGFLIILLIPVLFITLTFANQKRPWPTTILLSFFSSCLIIGAIDGGLWGTPAMVGIIGIWYIYRNGYYLNEFIASILNDNKLLKENEKIPAPYQKDKLSKKRFILKRALPILVIVLMLFLRCGIGIAGAEVDYYTVNIENMSDDIDFGHIPMEKIDNTTYHVTSNYNEMQLLNDLKVPLNNSCEYYTVSWNIFSYF